MAKLMVNIVLLLPILVYGCLTTSVLDTSSGNDLQNERFRSADDKKMVEFMQEFGPLVKRYSDKCGIDWRLVLAVARQESQFHQDAESHMGAEGIMQIMPATQNQIAGEMGLDDTTLIGPSMNIKGGIFYLAKLFKCYKDEGLSDEDAKKMALAAYNAGLGRIEDARRLSEYLNDDPKQWLSVKSSLSMLSSKYSSLHEHVWADGKPASGYFKQWRQTTGYVDDIMHIYGQLCQEFPRNS